MSPKQNNQTVVCEEHVFQYKQSINQIIIDFETMGFDAGSSFSIEILKCIQNNNIPLKSFQAHKVQRTDRRER